ncbi:SIR2 family protein [Gilliamella sp. B14384G15]|uniref:SIR2 family protein n=1 Tax=unclassified Gilliamella TaxID=2685620 RepID=UPI0018DB4A2E|nr:MULTISPECIES: SIR2 family protein [unclassified Gilliamella]MBI0031652.1 SIR2 family protein [Gilliamella sp. B14384G15]MBI0059007.1 SIR2 family protein [Gilliamella sp. B14384G12]
MENLNCLSFNEKDIKNIITASQNNKLVFFIGAGFSKLSETESLKIPSWEELINELKEDLKISNESDFLKIAQLYFLKFGEHAYYNKVKSSIKDLAPSKFHKNLFDLNPHYIITTNWDNLIENTAQEKGLAYDLICSDADLAHSQLDKKIIKMHGSFQQHNFVFKEDDYLQYSQNFPLIENYIKGIFSTCTIVFLGYSYSDYNLKQIVSWITRISKATPKKYLLQGEFDLAQNKYLENYGITLLSPIAGNLSYGRLYESFFEDLNTVIKPEKLIVKLVNSVKNLVETESNEKQKDNLNEYLNNKVVKYFNDKISPLSQYQILLPELVRNKLTNCTLRYNGLDLILDIYDNDQNNYITDDFNKEIRDINLSYIKYVLNDDDHHTQKFLSILNKAFITKIKINDKLEKVKSKSNKIQEYFWKKMYFEYTPNDIEILFSNKKYNSLLKYFSEKVSHYLDQKNYIMTTIYMANYDYIYNKLKTKAFYQFNTEYEMSEEILENIVPFDFINKVRDFPASIQQDIQDLLRFIDLTEIYKAYCKFHTESQENKEYAQNRKNGGISWSSDEYTLRDKLYSYVYFISGNDLLIENDSETQQFFGSIILESFEHYLIDDKFFINKTDLFIIIKYCDEKKIKAFAKKLIDGNKFISICHLKPKYIVQLKRYLLKSLTNICKSLDDKEINTNGPTFINIYFRNILTVLGFARWNSKEIEQIIDTIIPVFQKKSLNLNSYRNIRYFLYVNWKIYETSHPNILKFIDIILSMIIKKEWNRFVYPFLDENILRNIYAISRNAEYKYNNSELLKEVLDIIKRDKYYSEQLSVNKLLLDIMQIGSEEVKELIDKFVNENILYIPCKKPHDYIVKLLLIYYGYSIPTDFIKNLKYFIDKNIPDNLHDSVFSHSRIESLLPELLKLIIENKDLDLKIRKKFQSILKQFDEKMKSSPKITDS